MSRGMRIWTAALAGAQVVTAGTALADFVGARYAAMVALVVGACQVATAAYRGDPVKRSAE